MRNPQLEYLDGPGAGRPGRETMGRGLRGWEQEQQRQQREAVEAELAAEGINLEQRRERMTQQAGGGIGRPRGAAARVGGRGPDAATLAMRADWRDELAKMKARLEQLG